RASIVPRVMTARVRCPDEVLGATCQNLSLIDWMNSALFGHQKCRATPHTNGAQGQRRGDTPPVADTTSSHYRFGFHGIDDLRDQRKVTNRSGMPAGFVPLSDDHIGAFARVAQRMLHRASQRHHLYVSFVGERHDLCGIAETDDENRYILF